MIFEQTIGVVIPAKTAEGLRERTLFDYSQQWKYFVNWLTERYEITYIDELTPDIFHNHINHMKYDAKRYDGHKYKKTALGPDLFAFCKVVATAD
ncbi:hypothetical protein [Aneurinibacillus danicus]|uniref:Core-binding (CB) domain-containing protein n=1 Tax=Aneurinibacillus danicus TaxID=267746 RepID=A0A511V339_9BACL|nr:hypothetical protein [Aneurinibacillus danicus]GEN33304.1 hypothetical protein ADA01nite_07640 [Aneurinibacillus danicus]